MVGDGGGRGTTASAGGSASARPPVRIHAFTRSARQVAALRLVCRDWQTGPEAFWAFDFVLAAMGRPGAMAFFAATTADAPWDACVFVDVGPFTADLLYIYVKPASRRAGLARTLLSRVLAELTARPQLEALLLEVRVGNTPAQTLYEQLGMRHLHTRKAYYRDGEDAHVYMLELTR